MAYLLLFAVLCVGWTGLAYLLLQPADPTRSSSTANRLMFRPFPNMPLSTRSSFRSPAYPLVARPATQRGVPYLMRSRKRRFSQNPAHGAIRSASCPTLGDAAS